MTIIDAMTDPALFGRWFKSPTWQRWGVCLKALSALPMDETERVIYTHHTGREQLPSEPAAEGWIIAARRAGKSLIAALLAVFFACFRDYRPHLAPGEIATVLVLASDRRQARVIFRYVSAFLDGVPMLRRMVKGRTTESITLSNQVAIEVHSNSFRSIRGLTVCCSVCDELAFWRSDDSANPDTEVLNAIRPAMSTIPGALLLCISSPYSKRGELWRAYQRHFGKPGPTLVWCGSTQEMNPTISERVIREAFERDPQAAAAEYGGQFRSDLESYITTEAVDACIVHGRLELPRVEGVSYFAFVDPSGGSSDAMTVAIAHHESGRVILDCVRERKPPFSPEVVTREFAETVKLYGCHSVMGDRYGGEWPRERFQEHGIKYSAAEQTKSELYGELLPLLNSGKVELLDSARLKAQLCGLERRTGRGGKDSIDHAPGAHDDVVNAAAGALVLAHRRASKSIPVCFDTGPTRVSPWNFDRLR